MKMSIVYILLSFIAMSSTAQAQNREIQDSILRLIEGRSLTLGVSIHSLTDGGMVEINSNQKFPMQSIYKLPIALSFLKQIDNQKYNLGMNISINRDDLLPDTWSPFRERYPDGNSVSIESLLDYVVAQSDNNLTDILIDMAGGIEYVDSYVSKISKDIAIKNYERELKSSWELQFNNYATPDAIVELLQWFWERKELGSRSCDVLWQIMCNTKTGSARKLLRSNTTIGYKTGFSGKNKDGVTAANNCVGIVQNLDGEILFFSIFITNSSESEEFNYHLISQIVKFTESLLNMKI